MSNSSNKGNKLLLSSDDVRLLRYSDLVTHFPSLQNAIAVKDHISNKDISLLDEEVRNILLYGLGEFKNRIYSEWAPIKDGDRLKRYDNEEYTHCQVCNNPNCRYLYYIVNKINGCEIYVGSTCIYNYIDIGISGDLKRDYLRQQNTILKKIKYTAEFNKVFPDAVNTVKGWYTYYQNLPLKLPLELDKQFLVCYNRANRIIKNIQTDSLSKDSIDQFRDVLDMYQRIYSKINTYIQKNQNNRFALTSKTVAWLIQTNNKKLYNKLYKSCIITENEYKYIYERNFVLQFIPIYEMVFNKIGVAQITCNFENYSLFFAYLKGGHKIRFTCKMRDFFREYSSIIFYDVRTVDCDSFINLCQVSLDTVNYFINELENLFSHTPISIVSYYLEYDKLFLKNNNRNVFKELKISGFIESYKIFILSDSNKEENKDKLNTYVRYLLNSNWIKYEDYQESKKRLDVPLTTREFI